jgi:hypothetical protein
MDVKIYSIGATNIVSVLDPQKRPAEFMKKYNYYLNVWKSDLERESELDFENVKSIRALGEYFKLLESRASMAFIADRDRKVYDSLLHFLLTIPSCAQLLERSSRKLADFENIETVEKVKKLARDSNDTISNIYQNSAKNFPEILALYINLRHGLIFETVANEPLSNQTAKILVTGNCARSCLSFVYKKIMDMTTTMLFLDVDNLAHWSMDRKLLRDDYTVDYQINDLFEKMNITKASDIGKDNTKKIVSGVNVSKAPLPQYTPSNDSFSRVSLAKVISCMERSMLKLIDEFLATNRETDSAAAFYSIYSAICFFKMGSGIRQFVSEKISAFCVRGIRTHQRLFTLVINLFYNHPDKMTMDITNSCLKHLLIYNYGYIKILADAAGPDSEVAQIYGQMGQNLLELSGLDGILPFELTRDLYKSYIARLYKLTYTVLSIYADENVESTENWETSKFVTSDDGKNAIHGVRVAINKFIDFDINNFNNNTYIYAHIFDLWVKNEFGTYIDISSEIRRRTSNHRKDVYFGLLLDEMSKSDKLVYLPSFLDDIGKMFERIVLSGRSKLLADILALREPPRPEPTSSKQTQKNSKRGVSIKDINQLGQHLTESKKSPIVDQPAIARGFGLKILYQSVNEFLEAIGKTNFANPASARVLSKLLDSRKKENYEELFTFQRYHKEDENSRLKNLYKCKLCGSIVSKYSDANMSYEEFQKLEDPLEHHVQHFHIVEYRQMQNIFTQESAASYTMKMHRTYCALATTFFAFLMRVKSIAPDGRSLILHEWNTHYLDHAFENYGKAEQSIFHVLTDFQTIPSSFVDLFEMPTSLPKSSTLKPEVYSGRTTLFYALQRDYLISLMMLDNNGYYIESLYAADFEYVTESKWKSIAEMTADMNKFINRVKKSDLTAHYKESLIASGESFVASYKGPSMDVPVQIPEPPYIFDVEYIPSEYQPYDSEVEARFTSLLEVVNFIMKREDSHSKKSKDRTSKKTKEDGSPENTQLAKQLDAANPIVPRAYQVHGHEIIQSSLISKIFVKDINPVIPDDDIYTYPTDVFTCIQYGLECLDISSAPPASNN